MAFSKKVPAVPSDAPPQLPGDTVKDPTKWAAASAATYDTTGMNIPGYPTQATGEQIRNAIQQLAINNKDNGKIAGPIRQILQNYAGNYTNKEKHLAWTSKDNSSLESWLGQLNGNNAANPSAPMSLAAWKTSWQANPNYSNTNAVTTTPYSIPAQPDLTAAAQTAFSSVLGRSASPQEAADFAKIYQELVQSYDSAKSNAKAGNAFAAPSTPIQFAESGQTPASTALPSDPSASTGLEAPPTPSVAASNFAAQTNPTQASAQSAADGLEQFLSMLKGS